MHELLREWLPERRWFAGKGRPIASLTVHSSPWLLRDPHTRVEVVSVSYADELRPID